MDNTLLIVILVIAVIAIAAGVWFYYQKNKSRRLKENFGPEYDRTVERSSSREIAEKELSDRQARVSRFKIVPLANQDLQDYQAKWSAVQAQFVDEPRVAVSEGNHLVQEVMRKRGYPIAEFEQSAADLSVEYPLVVENYRAACTIAERNKRGTADTEELRRALVSYRTLFDELLNTETSDSVRKRPELVKPAFGRKSSSKRGMHP